jgi:hypothetical protein
MRKRRHIIFAFSGLAFVMATLFYFAGPQAPVAKLPKQPSASSWRAPAEMKAERAEHFRRLLRDPASDVIPRDAKRKDADFAKQVEALQGRSKKEDLLYWYEAGPNDVGGRTRALAVDVTNSDVVIAGGVSGGIWKSTDRGASWRLRSTNAENYSVSALAQDPRAGSTNVWYYASGEFAGNSASLKRPAIAVPVCSNRRTMAIVGRKFSLRVLLKRDTEFDYVSDIVVSPTSGSVFLAANGTVFIAPKMAEAAFNWCLARRMTIIGVMWLLRQMENSMLFFPIGVLIHGVVDNPIRTHRVCMKVLTTVQAGRILRLIVFPLDLRVG